MNYDFFKLFVAFVAYVFVEKKENAFAVFRCMAAITSATSFAYSHFLCMKIKIYITLGTAVLSLCGYLFHCSMYPLHKQDDDMVPILEEEITPNTEGLPYQSIQTRDSHEERADVITDVNIEPYTEQKNPGFRD